MTVKGESSSFVQRFCSDLAISGFSLDFMSLGVPPVGCDSNDFGEGFCFMLMPFKSRGFLLCLG